MILGGIPILRIWRIWGSDMYAKMSSVDMADILPADPFDMDTRSTNIGIKGWPLDFDEDFSSDFEKYVVDESEKEALDDGLLSTLGCVFDSTMRLQPPVDYLGTHELLISRGMFDFCGTNSEAKIVTFEFKANKENGKGLQNEGYDPLEALQYALHYLGLKDLLSVERVSRSLRDAVRGDPLLWKSIHIDQPLSMKIKDESLFRLTNRAQGDLQCLSLINCIDISDYGLEQVLRSNPRLTKLFVPGCLKLTADGILCNLRVLQSTGNLRIKQLRIDGISCVSQAQFEEFKSLLSANNHMNARARRPVFFPQLKSPYDDDDDRSIDIETCPRCLDLKVVYDCPAESCQQKQPPCRACLICIERCANCGSCIEGREHEETFTLQLRCKDHSVCFNWVTTCQDDREADHTSSSSSSGTCHVSHRMLPALP